MRRAGTIPFYFMNLFLRVFCPCDLFFFNHRPFSLSWNDTVDLGRVFRRRSSVLLLGLSSPFVLFLARFFLLLF